MGCCCGKKQAAKVEEKKKEEEVIPIDIQALIRKYANQITEWVVQENEEELTKIIGEGFSPDIVFDAGGYDTTILILTIAFKKEKLAQRVLSYNQNLNVIVKPNNDSALIMAISHRNLKLLELLIQKGANRNVIGPQGKTAVELATQQLNKCKEASDEEGIQIMTQIKDLLQNYSLNQQTK